MKLAHFLGISSVSISVFNSVILLFSDIDPYRLFFSLSAFCFFVLFFWVVVVVVVVVLFIYFHFLSFCYKIMNKRS